MQRRLTVLLLIIVLLPGCGLVVRGAQKGFVEVASSELLRQGRHGRLSEQERLWAKTAWKYFVNNYHADTGLVNGRDNVSVVSAWNIADAIAATVAAHHLELVDDYEFDHRVASLLKFLNGMDLSHGLPNLFYRASNGKMSDGSGTSHADAGAVSDDGSTASVAGVKARDGSGWSAVDVGRLLVWLKILRSHAPQYAEYVDKAVLRWNFCQVIDDCGVLQGVNRNIEKEPPSPYPKEPLGYQDYALMGYAAWGFPQRRGMTKPPMVRIYDVDLPYGKEDSRSTGSSNPLVSLPYLLLGLEFNWDLIDDRNSLDSYHSNHELADLAQRIYDVQEKRHQYEGIFTARTEQQRNSEPRLLFDAIFADGYAWNTLTPEGERHPALALVSTQAAFGMWALWKTPYTDDLMQLVSTLYDPDRGWFEGRLEKDGAHERSISCTTNAVVLEALHYKSRGKLYRMPSPISYADILLQDEFRRPACFPPERGTCQDGKE